MNFSNESPERKFSTANTLTSSFKNPKQIIRFFLFSLLLSFTINSNPQTNNPSNQTETKQINTDLSLILSSEEASNKNPKKIEKNILVLIFPGGKSHNFVMKELFDFTKKNEKSFKYNYHILVHNWDKDFWAKAEKDFTIYGFGDIALFDIIFNSALALVREDPVFGYSKFNKAMIHILDQFMQSNLLETHFRKLNFDLIITDIPNFLHKFLHQELDIPLAMYLSPPALPNVFWSLFEMNPATLPAIGTPFTDELTFLQRLQNTVYMFGTKLMFNAFMGEQVQVFKNYGYNWTVPDVFIYDSLLMIQYPPGFAFNISKPPSMVFLNYITPKDAKELEDVKISEFLSKHEKNIYMSQGTIMKNINFDEIIEIFTHFNNCGFVLSIKKEVAEKYSFPSNVFITHWVNQNDLLGDKRVNLFITHSGINSVLEALYHEKPVIALGVSLDQVNTAGMVKARETGIVFTKISEITPVNMIPAIELLLQKDNKYLVNTKKYSKILKMNHQATDVFLQWLEYGFEVGYGHLRVKALENYSYIAINNYDVGVCIIIILILFVLFIKNIIESIFCYGTLDEKIKKE